MTDYRALELDPETYEDGYDLAFDVACRDADHLADALADGIAEIKQPVIRVVELHAKLPGGPFADASKPGVQDEFEAAALELAKAIVKQVEANATDYAKSRNGAVAVAHQQAIDTAKAEMAQSIREDAEYEAYRERQMWEAA